MAYTKDLWTKRIASRSDLSAQVVHLTRGSENNGTKVGPVDVLIQILRDRRIVGSSNGKGFIYGDVPATCFQDAPVYSISQNIHSEEQYRAAVADARIRYMGVGLMFPKPYVFARGGRPVFYETSGKAKSILPEGEWWRIVRLDLTDDANFIDWTHEREWRVPGSFEFELAQATVVLPNSFGYQRFLTKCREVTDEDILGSVRGIVCLGAVFY